MSMELPKSFWKETCVKIVQLVFDCWRAHLEFDPCNPSGDFKMTLWPKLCSLQQWYKLVKTKNAVLNYHDLSLVHETQKILPISDAMFEKGKKFSGGSPLEKKLRDVQQEREGAISYQLEWKFCSILSYLRDIWGYLCLSQAILVYFCLSWSISVYLDLPHAISGYLRLFLAIFGYICLSIAIPGYLSLSQDISAYLWLSQAISGYLWLSQAFSGYLWLYPAILVYLGLSWAFPGFLRLSWAFSGWFLAISGYIGLCLAIPIRYQESGCK